MRKSKTIWVDQLLFGLVGTLGVILLAVSVGSQHEPLHQNWNLVWALPTHLVAAAGFKRWRQNVWFSYYVGAVVLIDGLLLIS